jgi:hypothetical protein
MRHFVRGWKPGNENRVYEIGAYPTKEIAEKAAEKFRENGWLFVGVTPVAMRRHNK